MMHVYTAGAKIHISKSTFYDLGPSERNPVGTKNEGKQIVLILLMMRKDVTDIEVYEVQS